jgi:hypothetical protein
MYRVAVLPAERVYINQTWFSLCAVAANGILSYVPFLFYDDEMGFAPPFCFPSPNQMTRYVENGLRDRFARYYILLGDGWFHLVP